MIIKNQYAEDNIYGESKILSSKGISEPFDILFCVLGWESRCCEILNYIPNKPKIRNTVVVSFLVENKLGHKREYQENFQSELSKKKIKFQEMEIEIDNQGDFSIDRQLHDFIQFVNDTVKLLDRPLSIAFDITSCPRRILLQFLIFCLQSTNINRVTFFYSQGDYGKIGTNYKADVGDWNIFEMVELDNEYSLSNKTIFIISAGFEEQRYRREIEKYEPYNLGLLLPYPGFTNEYTKQSLNICEHLVNDYHILPDNIIKSEAGDAIQAWKSLDEASITKGEYNFIYLPFGPKPHVLAMGIHAFLNKNIHLMYRIPKRGYKRNEVKSTGIMWQYEITKY